MPMFHVTKGHDAYVNYTTAIEAETAEQAQYIAGARNYIGAWIHSGYNEYDHFDIHGDMTEQTDDPIPVVHLIEVSPSQFNAIMAGLRLIQRELPRSEFLPQGIHDIFDNSGTEQPLTVDEIDQLCERIN